MNSHQGKVLVIAAHPDDEVLGCGGTMARLSREGIEVKVAILGEGVTSRGEMTRGEKRKALNALRLASRKAGRVVGVNEVLLFNLPDNRFDEIPLLDVIKIVESLVQRFQPDVIYTHHGGDLNNDHGVTHRAVLTATRPCNGCSVKSIFAFEVASSTEWSFSQLSPVFRPSVFIDVSATLGQKIEALGHYDAEMRQFPHPRSMEALTALAKWRGSTVGLAAAEAFECVRIVV